MASSGRFRGILDYYVAHKLHQNGISLEGFELPCNAASNAVLTSLTTKADKLIEDNSHFFDSVCEQLHLTEATVHATLLQIADELFPPNEINCGRIVSFLAFGGTLVVFCARRSDLASSVTQIRGWLSSYMEEKLGNWLDEQAGTYCWNQKLAPNDKAF